MHPPDWVEPVVRYMLETGLKETLKMSALSVTGSAVVGSTGNEPRTEVIQQLAGMFFHEVVEASLARQYQYSTGMGSRARQRYHVATLRHGAQRTPNSRNAFGVIRTPSW